MKHLLRYYIPADQPEKLDEIVAYCGKTGCRELLLFTGSIQQPSFMPLTAVEAYSDRMIEWAHYFRSKGIEISVNVLQTLGHVCFPQRLSALFPFQRMVLLDGTESTASACPLGHRLQEYLVQAYRLYARVKPRIMFVDDDFRFMGHGGMRCFCPLHLEALSEKTGRKVGLKELSAAILSDSFPADPLKEQFHSVLSRSLVGLAERLREAVREVSPKTRLGAMPACPPYTLWGYDPDGVARAMAGDKQPLMRPQIAMYAEVDLKAMPRCLAQPAVMRNLVQADVEIYPEIENYLYTNYAKSAQVTFLQMASCVLHGMDNLALNIFDMFGSPFSESREIVAMLVARRPFFAALRRLVPTGARPEGIAIPMTTRSMVVRRAEREKPDGGQIIDSREWDNILPLLGLPLGYDWDHSPFVFLTGDEVLGMDRKRIDALLKKGAVMDARAAECLCLLGYSERIGISVGPELRLTDDLYHEHFVETFPDEDRPIRSPVPISIWSPEIARIRSIAISSGNAKVLSDIRNCEGRPIAPAVVVTGNRNNERFGVLAYAPGPYPKSYFHHRGRAVQLRRLFSMVAGKDLPAAVLDCPYVQPICVRSGKRRILGLVNFSTDTYTDLTVSLAGPAVKNPRVRRLTPQGELVDIGRTSRWVKAGGVTSLRLRLRLPPAGLEVFVIEGRSQQQS